MIPSQRAMLRSIRLTGRSKFITLCAKVSLIVKRVLRIELNGLRSSCATVAVSWPSAESRSLLTISACAARLQTRCYWGGLISRKGN